MSLTIQVLCAVAIAIFTMVFVVATYQVLKKRQGAFLSTKSELEGTSQIPERGFGSSFLSFVKNFSFLKKISIIIFALMTVVMFVRLLNITDYWIIVVKMVVIQYALIFITVIDFATKKIPNYVHAILSVISICFLIVEFFAYRQYFYKSILSCVVCSVICFALLVIVSLAAKGGFGMGDVKLLSSMTFLGGIAISIYSMVLGLFVCMVVSIVLLILKKKKVRDEIPFGPFIFIGYFIAVIIGKF